MDRVGLEAAVGEQDVVELDGFGDGEFGVLGFGEAAEDDGEGLDVGELGAFFHLRLLVEVAKGGRERREVKDKEAYVVV